MKKICLITLIFFAAGKSFTQNTAGFENFWATFQPLLADREYLDLVKHVQFPLLSKGVFDELPVKKITKENFAVHMENYLSIDDPNLNGIKLNIYKNWESIPDNQKQNIQAETARIDDMVFKKKNGKWLLVMIYDGRTE
jgi:hypothetical protein